MENLLLCRWIVCEVDHCLYRADSRVLVSPLVDSCCYFLNTTPVQENSVSAVTGVVSKLILLHPISNRLDRFNRQSSVNLSVVAEGQSVQLTERYAVYLAAPCVVKQQVAPHFHLALLGVNVFLDPDHFDKNRSTYV